MKKLPGVIAVDLDKTLAWYHEDMQARFIGKPIPQMLMRVKYWLKQHKPVVIFTARVWHDGTHRTKSEAEKQRQMIRRWCREHLGQELEITCEKRPEMIEFWDDRAISVIPNTGEVAHRLSA